MKKHMQPISIALRYVILTAVALVMLYPIL